MRMNKLVISTSFDPFYNLALEEYLFDTYESGVVLYLWRNERTIVIGRNQNAYRECRIAEFESSGGKVARRTTGGGAVYQDKGNLCYTFIAADGLYDEDKQLGVILKALRSYGIFGEKSGRNDLTVSGRKFSGNAFRHSGGKHIHHGTLLLNADMGALSRYLTVSAEKIEAKGVKSVAARVVNLAELAPALTAEDIYGAVIREFREQYGDFAEEYSEDFTAPEFIKKAERFASRQWRLGENPSFSVTWEKRFSKGEFSFNFNVKNGAVQSAAVYSDTLDADFPASAARAFAGAQFSPSGISAVIESLSADSEFKKELCEFFKDKIA